jgi:hypothetical protein
MSIATQIISILGFALILTILVIAIAYLERRYRINSLKSARFITANASTNLSKKIDRIVTTGAEIFIPAGQGLYPLRVSAATRAKWENKLGEWASRGAKVTILITSPNEEAVPCWQELVDRFPDNLCVCLLDRTKASEQDAIEITRLDRFHPILVAKGDAPLAMWIERDHPPRSNVAYNVEFLARPDIVDFQRHRFDRYLKLLRHLILDSDASHILTPNTAAQFKTRVA